MVSCSRATAIRTAFHFLPRDRSRSANAFIGPSRRATDSAARLNARRTSARPPARPSTAPYRGVFPILAGRSRPAAPVRGVPPAFRRRDRRFRGCAIWRRSANLQKATRYMGSAPHDHEGGATATGLRGLLDADMVPATPTPSDIGGLSIGPTARRTCHSPGRGELLISRSSCVSPHRRGRRSAADVGPLRLGLHLGLSFPPISGNTRRPTRRSNSPIASDATPAPGRAVQAERCRTSQAVTTRPTCARLAAEVRSGRSRVVCQAG